MWKRLQHHKANLIFLLSFHFIFAQQSNCDAIISPFANNQEIWFGVGINKKNDVDQLKEKALSDLALKLSVNVDVILSTSASEAQNQIEKKGLFRSRSKMNNEFSTETEKQTLLTSNISLSGYSFTSVKSCDGNFIIIASIDKDQYKNLLAAEAETMIALSENLINTKNRALSDKLEELNNQFDLMKELQTRLIILDDPSLLKQLNDSLENIRKTYNEEVQSIRAEFSFDFIPKKYVERDSNLTIFFRNNSDATFKDLKTSLILNRLLLEEKVLENQNQSMFQIPFNQFKETNLIEIQTDFSDSITSHFLFQDLGLSNLTIPFSVDQLKPTLYVNLTCNEKLTPFIEQKFDAFTQKVTTVSELQLVSDKNDADSTIECYCSRENMRQNSYDIYIMEFELETLFSFPVTNNQIIKKTPFFSSKSFISYDKTFSSISEKLNPYWEELTNEIIDSL